MKIALLTQGTRGDIEPFIILGKELTRQGHTVTVSAPVNFNKMILDAGLLSVPISIDVQKYLDSDEGKKMLMVNPFIIIKSLKKMVFPHIVESLNLYYSLCQNNDKILYHTKTLCDCFAGCFPGKMVRAMLVPAVVPTRYFANPALSGFSLFKYFPRQSYFVQNLTTVMFKNPIKEFLESRGIKPTSIEYIDKIPFVYAVSELLLEKPKDYPEKSFFTGFWREQTDNNHISPELERFLNNGKAPLVVTFGSMAHKKICKCWEILKEICIEKNERLIIVKGWNSNISPINETESVFITDTVPYDALFKRVKAVIHHGGVGTTAACIYAGIPMLVLPVMYPVGDQMFWGEKAMEKGLAVKPLPLKHITKRKLEKRINILLESQEIKNRCKEIKNKIANENGTAYISNLLSKNLI